MKKSVQILGLPIISITEGRELGMSKTLLMDAKHGTVAAITIEDADWYRGVKLIPYESVIAIGDDAVTVTSSENILTLDDAGDYEQLLDENIRIIGTKAITKSGTIQGKISEVFVGDDGKIEKCEVTAPDGTTTEVACDQISIFGKEVTVIDPSGEKKTTPVTPSAEPAGVAAPAPEPTPLPAVEVPAEAAPAPEMPEAPAAPAVEAPAPEPVPEAPAEEPKAEEAKAEEPKAEAPKVEEPKAEEAPKAEPAKKEAKEEKPKETKAPAKKADKKDEAKDAKKAADDKAAEERHRRFLLGKKAARTIKMDNGIVIVEAGQDITEEVLQKAKLSNKFIELSMNVQ